MELPKERLTAQFNDDSIFELTPDIVGPSITKNAGIIGEDIDLSLEHLEDMRRSTLIFNITRRLLYTRWRDPRRRPQTTSVWSVEAYNQTVVGFLPRLQRGYLSSLADVPGISRYSLWTNYGWNHSSLWRGHLP